MRSTLRAFIGTLCFPALLLATNALGQNRVVGATALLLDDGNPLHLFEILPPTGLGNGTTIFTFPATPPGGVAGFVNAGTVAGQTLYWNGTSWASSSGLFNDNTNGRIGVNNTSPANRLDVIENGLSYSAGRFGITNNSSSNSALLVNNSGFGSGIQIQLTNSSNGSRGVDVAQSGFGPGVFSTSTGGNGVWGVTSSISSAGVIGDNTAGEAVVGRTRGGNGVGAVVGRNDSSGYGVRGFNTMNGIGVLGQAGISGGTGIGGRFENVNAANGSDVLQASTNGTGTPLVISSAGSAANLAIFKTNSNQARIDNTGKGFFNGGTQTGGADVAEAFDVEGVRGSYEPGDVLVISTSTDRTVEKCSKANSTLVVGVYATKPGVLLTPYTIDQDLSKTVPMGVIGVIPTKVSAENGPINRGDLLVTSSTPGRAMKAGANPAVGTVIGKALQNLDGASGLINVLVNVR